MESLLNELPYLGVVVVLLLGGMGVPIPEDIPLLVSGYLCHLGKADIFFMLPLALAAVIGGDFIMFGLGRRFGNRLFRFRWLGKILTEDRLEKASVIFVRYGGRALFVGRFLPGLRACVFFSAGALRVPAWKMLVYDGSAALISVPTLILLTYFGGGQIDRFRALAFEVQLIAFGVAGVVGVAFWWWKRRQLLRRAAASADLNAHPVEGTPDEDGRDQKEHHRKDRTALA
jgi:membrane protein DedA with SNARE-associated domain